MKINTKKENICKNYTNGIIKEVVTEVSNDKEWNRLNITFMLQMHTTLTIVKHNVCLTKKNVNKIKEA